MKRKQKRGQPTPKEVKRRRRREGGEKEEPEKSRIQTDALDTNSNPRLKLRRVLRKNPCFRWPGEDARHMTVLMSDGSKVATRPLVFHGLGVSLMLPLLELKTSWGGDSWRRCALWLVIFGCASEVQRWPTPGLLYFYGLKVSSALYHYPFKALVLVCPLLMVLMLRSLSTLF